MTKRETNEKGETRCRVCGEFKPDSQMKGRYQNGVRVSTRLLCRECHDKKWPWSKEAQARYQERRRERKRPVSYATYRAYVELARRHPDEFKDLVKYYTDEAANVDLLGYQEVRAHLRAVYGTPS